ncbi:MAG TPA: 16S rRNA (uracil(1498)-N(3))-methyltransferase [Thermodesulfovibrionales bacterium]|nr:16S rRNA (uracil(1498)-N(3))-methyltransferase [Thermodesulfovibrionales bacterium]
MPRIFLPLEERPETIHIAGEKARYLINVLRSRAGDEIMVLDGKGSSYSAEITSIKNKELFARVNKIIPYDAESKLKIILIQGVLKGEKMELIIQKTTELGVNEIVPVATERSQLRETRKTTRWRKIAEDASRQCGRSHVPRIHDLIPFQEVFVASSDYRRYLSESRGLLFREEGGMSLTKTRDALGVCRSLTITIGPEGGFTKEEALLVQSAGFLPVSLGNRILRAETAAIAATALAQYVWGDLDKGV